MASHLNTRKLHRAHDLTTDARQCIRDATQAILVIYPHQKVTRSLLLKANRKLVAAAHEIDSLLAMTRE